MNLPKYRSIFASSPLRCVVSEEKDKYLSLASLETLRNFLPEINPQNIDLLPVSADACIVNRGNKNSDIINTDTALGMYKTFIHKFCDLEHNRHNIIGVTLVSSLSAFGTHKPLTEDDVKGKDFPFYITLGGILWKVANEEVCNRIEESNNPDSKFYMNFAYSWELAFSSFNIVEMQNTTDKNISDGKLITDPDTIEKLSKYLKCNGGSGVKDGKTYYRMPNQDVIAMGIGITEKPAAEVEGIAVNIEDSKDLPENRASTKAIIEINSTIPNNNTIKNNKIISQSLKSIVNKKYMTIKSISDITDENLKQCSASDVSEYFKAAIADAIQQAHTKWTSEKKETLAATQEGLQKTIEEMKACIDNLQKAKADREAVDTFNSRMTEVSASYELPAEVAKVVAEDLKGVTSDESYAAWKNRSEILLKPYSKATLEAIAKKKKEDDEAEEKMKKEKEDKEKESKASEDKKKKEEEEEKAKKDKEKKESVASAVDNAIDNADKEKGGMPNSIQSTVTGLKDKYKEAFGEEGFLVRN